MLKFEGVKKHYEDFELDLTLEVPEGYVTGLIGANGAGKSTAFKAALGLIRPDAGVVKMLGKNVEDFTVQDKEWIGVVLADSGFSGYLRVKDILPMLESMYHKLSSDTFWSPQTTHYNLQLFQEKSTIASQRHDHASFPAFYQLNAWLLIAANITSASITFLSI